MTSFKRKYVSEEDQLRMLQEVEKVLIERGYEYEYRDRLFFAEDMYDKVDWVIQNQSWSIRVCWSQMLKMECFT